ncbi:hypothetical protein A2U01_0056190, partial [Trifolium medium]|nr:hypothetical protein [Trifolium medium]
MEENERHITDDDGNATDKTSNVVYKEVFQNMNR